MEVVMIQSSFGTSMTCKLPEGVGEHLRVQVVQIISGTDSTPTRLQFESDPLIVGLSYAKPKVTELRGSPPLAGIERCHSDGSTGSLIGCGRIDSRKTNSLEKITIIGQNFGSQFAGVLISLGQVECVDVTHDADDAHSKLYCNLKVSQFINGVHAVIVKQFHSTMEFPEKDQTLTLQFQLCKPGTYQNGTNLVCSDCPDGTYTDLSGMSECSECKPGTFCERGPTPNKSTHEKHTSGLD